MAMEVRRMTYSVEQAADILGVSKSKLYDSIRNGEIRAVQVGRRVVIPCDEIEALVGPVESASGTERAAPLEMPGGLLPASDSTGPRKATNSVHLAGTLVRQAELRVSRTGLEVCTLRLAAPRRRRDGEERGALHIDVVAFGAVAAKASTICVGEPVLVKGRLGQREWTSKDGDRKSRFEIVAEEIERTETSRDA